jgi:hypothetical protein
MPSDLETLVEYGFDKEKAALALKKAGGCKISLRIQIFALRTDLGISAGRPRLARYQSGQIRG